MEEIDITYYSRWPIKIENENLAKMSEKERLPVSLGMPTRTSINTTSKCNLKCGMCRYHGQSKIPPEILPLETFIKIGEQLFPYSKELHPAVKGEPLLTPYLKEMINIIYKYGVKLNLTTNGMLLFPEISELIVPVLRDIKISFDGAKKETLEKIRMGSKYEAIIENIRSFVDVRDKYVNFNKEKSDFYRPTITIQSVLMTDNIEELPDIVRIAYDLGVDKVKGFNLTISDPNYLNKSLLFEQKLANKYLKKAIELADSLGIQTKYQDLFDENIDIFNYKDNKPRKRHCAFLWRQFNIESNGDVTPCCHDKSPIMGNIYKNSIEEIWNNRAYQEMRARLDSENPYDCCKHCTIQSLKVLDAYAFIFL